MKSARTFAFAQIAFFTFMWLSKSVHLLYFESQGAVVNFGLSYSAMALAGYFSFLTGHLSDRIGFRKTLSVGVLIYAVGLFLRIFPGSAFVAILSGLIAGVGASTALSAFRVWMVALANGSASSRMVGLRTSTTAFGTACGCFLFAGLPLLKSVGFDLSFRNLLLTSSIGLGVLSILFWVGLPEQKATVGGPAKKEFFRVFLSLYHEHKRTAVFTVLLGATTGFYVSFISPYLPLIMKDKGLDLAGIGLTTGTFSLLRFFVDPQISKLVDHYRSKTLAIFLGSELIIALITACFILPTSKVGFVLLLLLRSGSLGFSAISEETLWLGIFPRESVGLFFGLNQSAYFIGDFVGGLLNGYLYRDHGLDLCIEVVLGIMLINSSLFLWMFMNSRSAAPIEVRAAS